MGAVNLGRSSPVHHRRAAINELTLAVLDERAPMSNLSAIGSPLSETHQAPRSAAALAWKSSSNLCEGSSGTATSPLKTSSGAAEPETPRGTVRRRRRPDAASRRSASAAPARSSKLSMLCLGSTEAMSRPR